MLAQSPEQEVHDEVLDNNPDRTGIWKCLILSLLEMEMLVFELERALIIHQKRL